MSDGKAVETFDLAALDTDGAIMEAEAAVEGDSRADFLRKAALSGGALVGAARCSAPPCRNWLTPSRRPGRTWQSSTTR